MVSTKSSTTVSTLIKINQHIRIISEGSCDTDWSKGAENFTFTQINHSLKIILTIQI